MTKTAVVTGAAGFIGTAICRALVDDGWTVVAADLSEEAVERAFDGFEHGGRLHARGLDVTDEAMVDGFFPETIDRLGPVHAVVNNAGITRDKALHNMTLETFRAVLSVNLEGPFLMSRAAARAFRRDDAPSWGRIVNMSSISGKVGNFGQANYSSSKAALVALTKVTAKELASRGVTANAILPGFIDTPMTAAIPEEARQQRLREIPLGRAGRPEDVAAVVQWLCSDAAAYMTGAAVELTGGLRM